MNKKPTAYAVVIVLWLVCVALLGVSLWQLIAGVGGYGGARKGIIIALLSVNTAILACLWLGSIKDFIFSLTYAVMHKKFEKVYSAVRKYDREKDGEPEVLLLYCTCNDFNPDALKKSMRQNYGNFRTVILDDSSDPEYKKQIDRFASDCGAEVVRRKEHKGYKAGNLNNYLKGKTDYDYFVVLDSDEVIPPDYIEGVLKYFNYDKNCGTVQARHKATQGGNVFQRLMGLSVGSNGETIQVVKNFYGANALIGHGMTVSRACYEATGGFPLVVAEDISFAVKIKNAGYGIIYAPDILCYEEFPVDYVSLKKRQCKWTQGNLEYMKKFGKEITHSNMRWFEKLDLMLSHYSLPIVPVLSLVLTLCLIGLGFAGYPVIGYSMTVYAVMIVFLCSPMLPDLFTYKKSRNFFLLIPYFILNIATYASLAPMMLRTVFLGLCGRKAVFIVTPKQSTKFRLKEVLKYSFDSILFGVAIGALAWISCGNVLPVIYIVAGCLAAPFIILLSNITLPIKVRRNYIHGKETERALPLRRGSVKYGKALSLNK